MKRKSRSWTKDERELLGKLPNAEVADLTGRTFGTVWQKRRADAIHVFRKWKNIAKYFLPFLSGALTLSHRPEARKHRDKSSRSFTTFC